ncbi:Zn(II)2Cys6 transcription factor domain-containing protein [Sporobolomyces koalae]|uniref:Zn(II)2Cys6 transcription factor domain-containing protein n=1 Tax=Sporobolomyces koalae TaxID=500713 RepID=UPI00317782FA
MPPLGTKLPVNRARKPPSCDHCKRKRVLCHPSPAGCPRCIEKGVECTTTPVVRRRPAGRSALSASTASSAPAPARSPLPSAIEPREARRPRPSADTTTFTPDSVELPPSREPPSIATDLLEAALLPVLSSASYQLVPLHYPTPSLEVSPELAQHLVEAFAQSPQHEHPTFAAYDLERTLSALSWQVELLEPRAQVLAYCAFAVGALLSYHPSILDPFGLHLGRACPTSFLAVLEHLPDLRKFGRLRSAACRAYREEALRRAKASDVLFEPSREAVTTCFILRWLDSVLPVNETSSAAVWYAAEMSHLRTLCPPAPIAESTESTIRWACYLTVDSIQALILEQAPPSRHDQIALVGPTVSCEIAVDRQVEQGRQSGNGWPLANPHFSLSLDLSRRIYETLVAEWTLDAPFDMKQTLSIIESLEYRRRCASVLVRSLDEHIDTLAPAAAPHQFPSYPTRGPDSRAHAKHIPAMRSFRTVIQYSWSYLTLIVYHRLRAQQARSARPTTSRDRIDQSRLDLCVAEARTLARHGFAAILDSFERLASLTAWTHLVPHGMRKWGEFLLSELDEGFIDLDRNAVEQMRAVSNALKQIGFVWSDANTDSIILELDTRILSFQVESGPDSTDPVSNNSAGFANLTAISTPSSTEHGTDPELARPSNTDFGQGFDESLHEIVHGHQQQQLDELAQVLGLY